MHTFRHSLLSSLAALLLTLYPAAHAQDADHVVPPSVAFSGKIVSASGALPGQLAVAADCEDERPRIAGQINADAYLIELPTAVLCTVSIEAQEWTAAPQRVFDAGSAVPQTMLVYPRQVREPALAKELADMAARERALQGTGSADNSTVGAQRDAATVKRLAGKERALQRRLRQIITTKGWPTISMVGAEAAGEAWFVAQHAPPAQLKHWLIFMRAAARQHEIEPANLAATIDRVRTNAGQPQLYGTQYRLLADGGIAFLPIEDSANLDARRYSMGMSSHARYLQSLQPEPTPAPTPPTGT